MLYVNVLDSKAVFADGVHDDTKALQACLDELKNGGTVYFPDGDYLISSALIFYSHQILRFSDNARLLRSDKSNPVTRYLLASYSEKEWTGYNGTHDVIIAGGIFDGNENLSEPSTLINTVHCNNIVIQGCRFLHCSKWHCIELNSTENSVVRNCFFNGQTYVYRGEELRNELLQLDKAQDGSYGPVYDCDGKEIEFCPDKTACRNISIESNIFKCDGFPAIGHHDDCGHENIVISNNIFDGSASGYGKSRGYIIFMPSVSSVKVVSNSFFAPEKSDTPNIGIISENSDRNALVCEENSFHGYYSEKIIYGDTSY